ncbi:hypothetical protein O181_006259 [Austropuccinia psidii MF-1]|uniref:Uncharacterized protein n=1 Tax=Austropuccinia psidii MF-1 TaxID=1389203 RepID=A0A9Q3BJ01_9BASI|nr:hypothetical protein [Austropuccinia psidii MF-1]
MDFLLFQNLNQIIVEERSSISSLSKESIPCEPDRKYKGKEPEVKLEVNNSEAIAKIKEEPKKMIRNLDMAVGATEKWLALELSGMNEEDEGERQ